MSVRQILGYTDEMFATFYQAARHLLENRNYAHAADAFLFLVSVNATNADCWLGLGMASQMNKDFEGAIDAYEMAAINELDNPVPYLYLGKCFFALHEKESALVAFDLAIEYAGDRFDKAEVRELAIQARDLLQREAESVE